MPLIGFGPVGKGINDTRNRVREQEESQEGLSNITYETSNQLFPMTEETSNLSYDTSNYLFPRDEKTVEYVNQIIKFATEEEDVTSFTERLYNTFKDKDMIQ